ncbi:retrotransposable element Tf2 [Tanacetum coccineum]
MVTMNQGMNGNGRNPNQHQFIRMKKVDFPKFLGDDVKGQFIILNGENVSWNLYKSGILQRFDTAYDDPISEIRKVKYQTNAREYQDAFDTFLSRVDISEEYAKYTPRHKCSGQLYSLVLLADEDEEYYEVEEGGEIMPVQEELAQISLNALNGSNTFQTMRVAGKVGKHELHILVDCGSTYNFLEDSVAKRISYPLKDTCPLAMTVGGGKELISTKACKDFVWQLQGETFKADMMILPLGGCEMVLGIQWLAILGDIKCDFSQLKMEFVYNRRRMVLRGAPKATLQWMEGKHQEREVGGVPHDELLMLSVFPNTGIQLMNLSTKSQTVPKELQKVVDQYDDVFAVPKEHPPIQKDAILAMVKELLEAWVIKASNSLTGYYRRFIKGFASLSRPLTQLLKKNAFKWNLEAQLSFEALKKAMVEAPVLGLPDFNEPFVIETDASGVGLEFLAVLMALERWKVVYKKGLENEAADALFRFGSGNELLSMFVSSIITDLMKKVNENLLRKNKLAVGQDANLRRELLKYFHKDSTGGHSRVKVTSHKLCSLFYWKGMRKQVKQFVRECFVCQKCKPDLSAYPGLLQLLPIPQTLWSQISMDFIKGLPKSHGKDVIMVVVDRLSKMPKSIVLDRDKVFISAFWKELFRALKVKLHMSTTYHPQTDGQTEVAPPVHVPYVGGLSKVDAVDMTLLAREKAIQVLKFHLQRQVTIRMGKQNTFSQKFYGPFEVSAKVGQAAYKLKLPTQAQIHNVFHVLQLKKYTGPPLNDDLIALP